MKSPPSNQPPFIVALRQTLLTDLVEAVVTQGVPLLALTGPAGTGKTALAAALQQELLDRSVHVLRIGRGEGDRLDLRAVACQVLDKPEADFDADDIEALFDVMTIRSVSDQKLVLIIDDAELLGTDALGYLRLLCSIAAEEMPQIVFLGRTSFWDAPEHPSRADIRELITDRRELGPLSEAEARAFAEMALPECALEEDERAPRLSVTAVDADAARLDAVEPAPIPDANHPRRRLRFAPTLGAAMVMAAALVALYWQAFVHGDRMRAQAGPIHEMTAPAPESFPAQASAVSLVDADAPTIGELSPAPIPLPRIDQRWLLADTLDEAADAAGAEVALAVNNQGPAQNVPVSGPSDPADAPTIGELSPVPVPPARVGETWLLAGMLDEAAYSAAVDVGSAEENSLGQQQSVPVSSPSNPAAAETPAQPTMQAEAAPATGSPPRQPPDEAVVQQEPVTPAALQHDDAQPDASPRVLRVDAQADETPVSDAKAAQAAAAPTASAPDPSPLLSRGDAMLALGDIAAARLFYERAVMLGSAQGATSLGKTYDPAFLASIRATGVAPNRNLAATWYRKGAELGDMEGTRRLAMLPTRQ